jgi:flagellar protein FliO/FliZ
MFWYVVKLLVLLPLIAALAWGCLKLARRMQEKVGGTATKSVRVVETLMLSPTLRLAVIEFHGREILVSTSRQGLTRLAEAPAREPV